MNVKAQKRLAAKILRCGKDKVYIDPARLQEVSTALTAQDVRKLIRDGVIRRKPDKPKIPRRKKKRKKAGSRKGPMNARLGKKQKWMTKIRGIRRELKKMKNKGRITSKVYRNLYSKAKGGFFRNKSHLRLYIEQHNLFSEEK